jgi:MYXO-CTERM domain-containing protein
MRLQSARFGTMVAVLSTLAFGFMATPAFADDAGAPGECAGGQCGTPGNNGGGCGCGCGGSILVAYTDIGQTYEQSDDSDHDGIDDSLDNCPFVSNADQLDLDGDAVGDVCDNCVATANLDQKANECGDLWSSKLANFQVAGATNNTGVVVGAACDLTCTPARAAATPVTVALDQPTGGSTGVQAPESAPIPASGEASCSLTAGHDGGAPVGWMFGAVGLLSLGLVRRRRAS